LIFSSGDHVSDILPKVSIAYNKYTSRYVVAWNWMYDDGRSAIFAAEIGPFGGLERGPLAVVVSSKPWDLLLPAIVYNPVRHNFLLVWSQPTSPNRLSNVFAANLGISGLYRQGQTNRLTWDSGSHKQPTLVAHDRFDQILAVWNNSGYRIYGALISGDASRSRVPFEIADRGSNPSVAYNETSGLYLVVYHVSENGESAIKAQHIRPYENLGYTRSYEFVLAKSTDFRNPVEHPDVAYNTRYNEFMMVYDQVFSQTSSGTDRDIRAALFYDLGGALEDLSVYDTRYWTKDEYEPSVAYNVDRNEYLVVWSHRYAANDLDVHGRIVGSDGTLK
jgi:hypothetical protein